VLSLKEGRSFPAMLYLIIGKPQNTGPATRQLADILFTTAESAMVKIA
jgi:hypothetical protein